MILIKLFFKSLWIRNFLLAVVVAANLIVVGIRFDLSKSDWSGWVQAFGSIAAILAAVVVMNYQARSAAELVRKTDFDAQIRLARTIGKVVENSCVELLHALEYLDASSGRTATNDQEKENYERGAFVGYTRAQKAGNEAKQRLLAIPVHNLQFTDIVVGIIGLIDRINDFLTLSEGLLSRLSDDENRLGLIRDEKLRISSWFRLGIYRGQIISSTRKIAEAVEVVEVMYTGEQ